MYDIKTIKLDPPLKWAGGKRWLAPRIQEVFKDFPAARLVEPFCGGLSVALQLRPQYALLNDNNAPLINFYKQLEIGMTPSIKMENDSELYYAHRKRFNEISHTCTQEAAELFYYLNKTGYNGLCRFNKSGGFNVPFGKYSKISYAQEWKLYKEQFKYWQFTRSDFSEVALNHDDFIYCDPPYDVEFTQYTPDGFDWADQERLLEWLEPHKGPIMISNQATERIQMLYIKKGYLIEKVSEPRRISCTGDRKAAMTVLAYRNI